MYRNHTVAVVVPAYNEETLLGRVIKTMPDYVDHIVVVDDCSRDGTVETIRRYLSQLGEQSGGRLESRPCISSLRSVENRG